MDAGSLIDYSIHDCVFSMKKLSDAVDEALKADHKLKMMSTFGAIERLRCIQESVEIFCPNPIVKRYRKIRGKLYFEVWPVENTHLLFRVNQSDVADEDVELDEELCYNEEHPRIFVPSLEVIRNIDRCINVVASVSNVPCASCMIAKHGHLFLKVSVACNVLLVCLSDDSYVNEISKNFIEMVRAGDNC